MRLPILFILFLLGYNAYQPAPQSPVYILQRQMMAFMAAVNSRDERQLRALQTREEANRVRPSAIFAFYGGRRFVMDRATLQRPNKINGQVHFLPKTPKGPDMWIRMFIVQDNSSPTGWKISNINHLPGRSGPFKRKFNWGKYGRRDFYNYYWF